VCEAGGESSAGSWQRSSNPSGSAMVWSEQRTASTSAAQYQPVGSFLPAKPCGHFPDERAALKCVYLALMSLDSDQVRPPPVDHALKWTPEGLPNRLRRPSHPGHSLTRSTTKVSR
jgi:hypothetical protein